MTNPKHEAIEKFVEAVAADFDKYWARMKFTQEKPHFTIEYGRRFAKIVRGDSGSRSVHCFVEISSGDIYKAASWAAPAKHVRGNINTPDRGMSCMSVYGAAYLR